MFEKKVNRLFDRIGLSATERKKKMDILLKERQIPVKIIGAGQCGVGKTELLKSIFDISTGDLTEYEKLKTGAVKAVTKDFFSFVITNDNGFKVQFTDGPGFGEDETLEEKYFKMWINEIPNHDLLYWVLDGSSRDIQHIQRNIKRILDETGYSKKVIIILNKVDQILLSADDEAKGIIGWDNDLNIPSEELDNLIKQRTDDIIEKLEAYVNISRDQIVVCSARKRWNHGAVLERFLQYLPKDKRLFVSTNRDVKDFTELMSEKGKDEIRALKNQLGGN